MAAADNSPPDVSGQSYIFARVARNIGWLAGSTGFSAVTSVTFMALAARTLGPRGFGTYALVLTYAQLIGNLVQFQSWNAVIRYGAARLGSHETEPLPRLFGFTAILDCSSAIVGALVAVILVPIVGPYLHLSPIDIRYATWFGAAFLLTTGATATGILRLFNRFDLLAYSDSFGPVTRVVGAIAGWWLGRGVAWFLGVWALSAILQFVAQWIAALSLGHRVALGWDALRKAASENRRILPFMLKTNLSSSIGEFWLECGTLAVGAVAGPVEAGGFRIAHRFAQAMTKPVDMITRALFPEFARLVAAKRHVTVRNVLLRVSAVAASFAILAVGVTGLAGTQILRLLAGPRFEFAQPFFFLLTIASAINLSGFALTPFHNAHGRAGRVLRSGLVAALVYAALLGALVPTIGARGAAYASIGASVTIFVQLVLSAFQILGEVNSHSEAEPAAKSEVVEQIPDEFVER